MQFFRQPFWLALALATMSAHPAAADLSLDAPAAPSGQPEDVVEFPDFAFTQTVFAPDPKTGCTADPGMPTLKYLPGLPCEPDSYDDMCALQSKQVKEAVARKTAALAPYFEMKKQAIQSVIDTATRELGAQPPKGDPRRLEYSKKAAMIANKILPAAQDAIDKKMIADLDLSSDKVLATIERVRATFKRALATAPKLGSNAYLLDKILNCKLSIAVDLGEIDDNASMGSRVVDISFDKLNESTENGEDVKLVLHRSATQHRPGDDDSVLINPLEAAKYTCNLTLMPATWLECADATPSCVRTLFHELGHTLNSCNFYYANWYLRHNYEDVKDASVDSLKHAGVYSKFLGTETLDFAHTLVRATDCLAAMSDPQGALPSSCPRDPMVTDEFFERCGSTSQLNSPVMALLGYPSQWDEAEADFWGATGLAQWLDENYPTADARRRAFYDIWSTQCASDAAIEEAATNGMPHIRTTSAHRDQPIPSCVRTPRTKTTMEPWGDSHQGDRWRAERNLMRNSDLRRSLGCPAKDPRIPLTCSPIR